jgi:hypothetical protein
MQVIERRIVYPSRSSIIKVYPLGDVHAGTLHCSEDKIKDKVKEIQGDPLAYWIGLGDYGEFISSKDSRFDSKCIADWVRPCDIAGSQIEYIVNLFKPIKDKCIGLIEGNHEDAYRKHNDGDPHYHICDRLGLANLGYTAFARLVFERKHSNESHAFLGAVSHGAGGAITKGAKLTRLERFMDNFNARWYAHGHVHDIITNSKSYMDLTANDKIVARQKVGAMTGSWFTGYTQDLPPSYGEIKNYPPNAIGCPVFVFDPSEDTVSVEGK